MIFARTLQRLQLIFWFPNILRFLKHKDRYTFRDPEGFRAQTVYTLFRRYLVDNPVLVLTTYRQDHIFPCRAHGHIPIGEMSALRKLKCRFVLETRPDDNFIKTAVSPRERTLLPPHYWGPRHCRISRGRFQLSADDANLSRHSISV